MADENVAVTATDGLTAIQALDTIIKNRQNGTSELSDSWHFLQLYSYWGLFLPNSEASLKLKLGINDPLAYSFFPTMLEAYQKLHDASDDFINNIFNKVVSLGNDLKTFAEQAATEGAPGPDGKPVTVVPTDSLFLKVIECLNTGKLSTALTLITNMQEDAAANAQASGEVLTLLGGYKAKLADGVGKLANVSAYIDKDDKTSKATIRELSGDEDAAGSIANKVKLLREANDRYKQDVIKATTSLTYAWVFPYGTMAAVIVAGIFGDRAVKEMQNLDAISDALKTKSSALNTAITTIQTQELAKTGVAQAHALTQSAIGHTTVLQNAWNTLHGELKKVLQLMNRSTTTVDGQPVLQDTMAVETYFRNAGKAWAKVLPPIDQLTANPYITVSKNEVTIGKMAEDVEQEIKRLKEVEKTNAANIGKALESVDKSRT